MSATKPIRTFKPSPVPVNPGLFPTWAETPKTCFQTSGLNNDLFMPICVNEGADQLRGNHTARAADQHFCRKYSPMYFPCGYCFGIKLYTKGTPLQLHAKAEYIRLTLNFISIV